MSETAENPEDLDQLIREEAEKVFRHIAVDLASRHFDEFDISDTYHLDDCVIDPLELLGDIPEVGCVPTSIHPVLDAETGDVIGFEESWNQEAEVLADAAHSMSMLRAPDPEAFGKVKGKSGNIPFIPGGFDTSTLNDILKDPYSVSEGEDEEKYLNFEVLLDQPPGFSEPVEVPETVQPLEGRDVAPPGFDTSPAPPPGLAMSQPQITSTDLQHIQETAEIDPSIQQESKPSIHVEDSDIPDEFEALKIEGNDDLVLQMAPEMAEFTHAKLLDEEKEYPFELDTFQKSAVVAMEAGDSVFVAAHTSAGKTVVADYAIALGQLHKTRVIYTSPIKALSNQKFREFKNSYGDVGLITGDIQLETDAFCLIMTTEVLRSMLYNGSETIRELEWVIFDEVHYINDEERGHVWEEVLIMLPSHVKIVMLSATVPNCLEFADWVGRIKQRKITVIQTLKRPVPLEHFIYTGYNAKTRDQTFLIRDADGHIHPENWQKAKEAKEKLSRPVDPKSLKAPQQQNQKGGQGGGNRNIQQKQQKFQNYRLNQQVNQARSNNFTGSNNSGGSNKSIYTHLIYYLNEKVLVPAVIFVFSRKRCDEYANMLHSVDLTTESEKNHINTFFKKVIDRLKGSDKDLPQVLQMRSLCVRGFAVHHSGILPILKEVVELLFQRCLVKVLFATETFAMGVNMPARTVVFDEMEKFDGLRRRDLNPTEYVQMAGRAGRRGLDKTGIVFILTKATVPPLLQFQQLLMGQAVRLESKFRITYTMLLKLMRVEQLKVEEVMKRSYVERSSLRLVNERESKIMELREKVDAMSVLDCELCTERDNLGRTAAEALLQDLIDYQKASKALWSQMENVDSIRKTLQKGRIILISYPPLGIWGRLAVVLEPKQNEHLQLRLSVMISADESRRETDDHAIKKWKELGQDAKSKKETDLFLEVAPKRGIFPIDPDSFRQSYRIIEDLEPHNVLAICKANVKNVEVENIKKENDKQKMSLKSRGLEPCITKVLVQLVTFSEQWTLNGPPISLPARDLKINEVNLYETAQKVNEMADRLMDKEEYRCRRCEDFEEHFKIIRERQTVLDELTDLIYRTSADGLQLSDEYKKRIIILRQLNYIDKNSVVNLKGKVACEISHMEMLITELILDNHFESKTPSEIAAMFSALTCQYTDSNTDAEEAKFINPRMAELKREILDVARRFDHIQIKNEVVTSLIEPELKFGLMDAVYEWAEGKPFKDIMTLTKCQEGIIVRCIQRLDEVCKDVRNAARIIGDPILARTMEETSAIIKRDIVFAASLYTTDDMN
ncbi:unnamed protein product [Bursaphelenchus xylophilus]|uniref:(pine wood nematode) hypothetical protein n=1 Tax=Bursaphelenchus xylophilus TaxID=6326 RepID=A0A7I8XEP0_BURXY|nr:unnamed protein product [Bursaphelenchus xylophilus]CAG9113795.1 unnamed protein product [Bursaphelenchus xylophilus]